MRLGIILRLGIIIGDLSGRAPKTQKKVDLEMKKSEYSKYRNKLASDRGGELTIEIYNFALVF